jgi:transketolase
MTTQTEQLTRQTSEWQELAQQLRVDSIRSSTAAGSGHPTSSLSAADLMAVLMSKYLRYDFERPDEPANDHLVFSKGHASPLLYAIFKAAGAITDQEMLTFRRLGSRLQGHPTPAIPWVDVATGSLGQGLPIGVGLALAGKYLDKLSYRVWVLCGDSEMAEGSMWEAFDHAAHYQLSNLVAILDMNRLGQRGETALGWNSVAYAARAQSFGWRAIEIDGHDLAALDSAYAEAVSSDSQPTLIVAKTLKGRDVSFLENEDGWHGKALDQEQAAKAIEELGGERHVTIRVESPDGPGSTAARITGQALDLPRYEVGDSAATRAAYGDALKALGAVRPDVVALDGEVNNSTYAEKFAKAYPERYFEMYIAEQQMVAAAVAFSVRGYVPFASSFAAFFTRAYDFIRMAAISQVNIRLCGSHAGVSIGEDGPSQMGLEDLAMMRAVHGSTVLYPSDANQAAQLVAAMADQPGVSFLRTTREKTLVIYRPDDRFTIGGSQVVRQSENDQVTVIAAGITVHEALEAYDELREEGTAVRVVDAYSLKPIDVATLRDAARATQGRVVVAEDHYPEGGLGGAVIEALAEECSSLEIQFRHLAVRGLPASGKPKELLDAAGISAKHIARAVRELIA